MKQVRAHYWMNTGRDGKPEQGAVFLSAEDGSFASNFIISAPFRNDYSFLEAIREHALKRDYEIVEKPLRVPYQR